MRITEKNIDKKCNLFIGSFYLFIQLVYFYSLVFKWKLTICTDKTPSSTEYVYKSVYQKTVGFLLTNYLLKEKLKKTVSGVAESIRNKDFQNNIAVFFFKDFLNFFYMEQVKQNWLLSSDFLVNCSTLYLTFSPCFKECHIIQEVN